MANCSDDVIFDQIGNKRVITLNRPKSLNAINLSMIRKIYSQLKLWDTDSDNKLIIIRGSGERAFSSGADVKAIAESGKAANIGYEFFREEYRLNNLIGSLSVPYVALINGICMGGGVGLSIHGPFRVVTERAVFAMPETAIGFFPDVGSSYFLPPLGSKLGLFLALTGHRLTGYDIFKAGIATHFVPSAVINELEEQLLEIDNPDCDSIEQLLTKYQRNYETGYEKEFSLTPFLDKINVTFGNASSVEQIIDNFKKDGSEWALKQIETLQRMSPTSLKVVFKLLTRDSESTLADCLRIEYRVAQRFMETDDFFTGVSSVLITKTNNPVWNPSKLSDVSEELVQSFFAALDGDISELTYD